MDPRVKTKDDVIEAGRIVIEGGMLPRRIVLRKMDDQYVTHEEALMPAPPKGDASCGFVHHSFASGHYYNFSEFSGSTEDRAREAAYADFIERCKKF